MKKHIQRTVLAILCIIIALSSLEGLAFAEPSVAQNLLQLRQQELSAGGRHTVRVDRDGYVYAVGDNEEGQLNLEDWTDVTKVVAGIYNTVGLRSDGTVYATGLNTEGQCNTSSWTDIIDVDTGHWHTAGLREDGTVVAIGFNAHEECEVNRWKNIVQVTAGEYFTAGLKDDGTVITTGDNLWGQCNTEEWTKITAIDAGYQHLVGLLPSGRVVATGRNQRGQCNVSGWEDVVQVSAGTEHTVALCADGTVVAVGNNEYGQCNVSDWYDMLLISAGQFHTVGLRADGVVLATGWNAYHQCDELPRNTENIELFRMNNTEASYKDQLELILNSVSLWSITDDWPNACLYSITDLDHNGRLEVFAAVNYGTGNMTHIEIFEVDQEIHSMKYTGNGVSCNYSALIRADQSTPIDLILDHNYPDVLPYDSGKTTCAAFRSSRTGHTGQWYYCFVNFNSSGTGADESEIIIESLTLQNGDLDIRRVVQSYTNRLEGKTVYFGEYGDIITKDEFDNWESLFEDCEKITVEFGWFSLYDELTLDILTDSLLVFERSCDENISIAS